MMAAPEPSPFSARAARIRSASEWGIALLLCGNLAWTSLCLGGVRAGTMVWTSVLTLAALALALLRETWTGKGDRHWTWRCLGPFLIYAAFGTIWVSSEHWLALRELWMWAQIIIIFYVARAHLRRGGPRRLVAGLLALLGAIAVFLSAWQLCGHETWLMLGREQAPQYTGRASGFFGNPNSLAAFYALLVPPALALAWRRGGSLARRLACGGLALSFTLGLLLTLSRGGLIALALALVCWPWFAREWRWRRRALACAAILGAIAICAIAIWGAMPAARERAETLISNNGEKSRVILWRAALQITAASPLTGAGGGSFNNTFEQYRPAGFLDEPQWAHNEFLNVISDHGIAGFVLLLGGIAALVWRNTRRRPPAQRHAPASPRIHECEAPGDASSARAPAIGLLAFAFACMVDFHLRIPALGMIVAIISAEVLRRQREFCPDAARHQPAITRAEPAGREGASHNCLSGRPPQSRRARHGVPPLPPPRLACRALGSLGVILLVLFLAHVFIRAQRAEAARVAGREIIDSLAIRGPATPASPADAPPQARSLATALAQAGGLFDKAITLDPENAQAWSDRAYALALRARLETQNTAPLGAAAEDGARTALRLAPGVHEFWLRLGVALDLQGRSAEAGDAFARALALAPASPLAWYHQAWHLGLTPATRQLALGAIDMCLRLDPGHADADSLRIHLQSLQPRDTE